MGITRPKNEKNTKTMYKKLCKKCTKTILKVSKRDSKYSKMFMHADISPMVENFMSEMMSQCQRSTGGRTGVNTDNTDETEWKRCINLKRFPTKPEDLHVKLDGNKVVLSGKSEVEKDQCGFKVFSTHFWTKEIQIP